MKRMQRTVIAAFTVLIIVLSVGSSFVSNRGFSAYENRKLSSKPKFTVKSFFKGQYEREYERYMMDNFPYRDKLLRGYQVYTGLFYVDAFPHKEDVLIGIKNENFVSASQEEKHKNFDSASLGEIISKVVPKEKTKKIGEVPQPLENQQQNRLEKYTEDPKVEKITSSLIIAGNRVMMPSFPYKHKEFGALLSQISEAVPNVKLYSITAPTSAAFYASNKYKTKGYDQSLAEKHIEATAQNVNVVKVYDELFKHKAENIYFRSDVHWSALGAYYAYTAFCQSANIQPANIKEDFIMGTYEPFLGGLYSQIYRQPQAARLKNNPERLDYYIPKFKYKMTLFSDAVKKIGHTVDSIINTKFSEMGAYKYGCFTWGDQPLVKIETDNPNGRKVLLIKDSFGSAFAPFLTANYSEVYIIDPRGFNNKNSQNFDAKTLINEEKIDDVILCFGIYGGSRDKMVNCLTKLLGTVHKNISF